MREFLRSTIYNRSYVLDLMVALLLVTTIFFLVGQRNESEQLQDIAKSNHDLNLQNTSLLQRVKSCTDPEGQCYKDNAVRTAGAVDDINKVAVLAASCADKDGVQTAAEIQKCVEDQLKKH